MSQERTTQDDLLTKAMYGGVALLLLMKLMKEDKVTHKRYVDDGNAVGRTQSLKSLQEKRKNITQVLDTTNIIAKGPLFKKLDQPSQIAKWP